MLKSTIVAGCSSLVIAIQAAAQSPTNIAEWLVSGNALASYTVGSDPAVFRSGASSGHIRSIGTPSDAQFSFLSQLVRTDNLRGKRVRFAGYVKTRDVAKSATIMMRIDADRRTAAGQNVPIPALAGSNDWTKLSVVLDVPADAIGIQYGLVLAGGGEAWLDDVTFEVVGTDVAVSAPPLTNARPAAQQLGAVYARLPTTTRNPGLETRP